MNIYTWTGSDWYGYNTATHGGTPGPGDTIIFRAGIADDVVLGPTFTGTTYHSPGAANLIVNAGATADLGTFSSIDASSYDNVTFGNVFIGRDARLGLLGSIEGYPAAETLHAGTVVVAPGATLNLGTHPVDGPDTIGNLDNAGVVIAPSTGDLLIGGPGFVQIGLATPGETNLHSATTDMIDLGDVKQGSQVPAIVEALQNGSGHAISGAFVAWGDGGFTPSGFAATTVQPNRPVEDATRVGTVAVNTSRLGVHVEVIHYTGGYDLTVFDRVVA